MANRSAILQARRLQHNDAPLPSGEREVDSRYRLGFMITTANGGSTTSIEYGRP